MPLSVHVVEQVQLEAATLLTSIASVRRQYEHCVSHNCKACSAKLLYALTAAQAA